jgi:hypothetical protein
MLCCAEINASWSSSVGFFGFTVFFLLWIANYLEKSKRLLSKFTFSQLILTIKYYNNKYIGLAAKKQFICRERIKI